MAAQSDKTRTSRTKDLPQGTPGEVPSSMPQQDLPPPSISAGLSSRARQPTTTQKKPAPAAKAARGKAKSTLPPPSDDDDVESDDHSALSPLSASVGVEGTQPDPLDIITAPKYEGEDEGNTEPADDMPMDVDDESPGPISVKSGKRKRSVHSPAPKPAAPAKAPAKAPTKVPARRGKGAKAPSATPSVRSIKRIKTQTSGQTSAGGSSSSNGSRVFALWKSDGYYYPATVYAHSDSTRFLVHYDDGDTETVDVSKMRRLELHVGDHIFTGKRKGKVVNANHGDHEFVKIESSDDNGPQTFDVQISTVRIPARSITGQWSDRVLSADEVLPVIRPRTLNNAPSPSKNSVYSAASAKARIQSGPLAGFGFVVTMSPGCENYEKQKLELAGLIEKNGGVHFDDWSDVFPLTGHYEMAKKRWVVTKDDFKCTLSDGVDRLFLLSDDASQKPRYLIALALGIPCVSTDWLRDGLANVSPSPTTSQLMLIATSSAQANESWQRYLLPAGFSDELNARVSQLVDLNWGESIEHLTEILTNSVALKLLSEMSFLIIGDDHLRSTARGKAVRHY